MYNNISLEKEKQAMRDALPYFDQKNEKEMKVYETFERCAKENVDAKRMIELLEQLGDLDENEYDKGLIRFVEARKEELASLVDKASEMDELQRDVQEKNEELEDELEKRSVEYDDDIIEKNREVEKKQEQATPGA